MDLQVTCINKQPRNNPHEGITHFGGYGWKWTRQEVINAINCWRFLSVYDRFSSNIPGNATAKDRTMNGTRLPSARHSAPVAALLRCSF